MLTNGEARKLTKTHLTEKLTGKYRSKNAVSTLHLFTDNEVSDKKWKVVHDCSNSRQMTNRKPS